MTEEELEAKVLDLARQLKALLPEGYGGAVVVVSPDEQVRYASNMDRAYVGGLLSAKDVDLLKDERMETPS